MLAASGVYVVAVSVRLARFNIATPPMAHNVFYGMPTTLIGAALAGWYLTWHKYTIGDEVMSAMPFVLLVCAFAMISNVLLPKLKLRSNLPLNVFLVVNIIFSYVAAPTQHFPEVLFGQALVYMGVGSMWYFFFPPSPDDKEKVEDIDELLEEEPEPVIAR